VACSFDHRGEVDREILEGEEFAEKVRAGAPSIFEERGQGRGTGAGTAAWSRSRAGVVDA